MASIYDVQPNDLIERTAVELAKMPEIAPPEWARFVKTGHFRQRPPIRQDWWYIRAAAVLRSVYKLGPIGVSKLRTKYGGKKDRGHKPEHTYRAGGNILRKVLQQLEAAKLIKQGAVGVHKGRIITPKGISLLDKTATQIRGPKKEKERRVLKKKKPKVIPKKEEPREKPAREVRPKKDAKPKAAVKPKKEAAPKKESPVKKEPEVKAKKPEAKTEEKPVKEEKAPAKKEEKPVKEEKPASPKDPKGKKVPTAHELAAEKKAEEKPKKAEEKKE